MWSFTSNKGNMDKLGIKRGSATNLQTKSGGTKLFNMMSLHSIGWTDSCSQAKHGGTLMSISYVLIRVEAANAMAMVTASSLLIGNLLPAMLCFAAPSSLPAYITLWLTVTEAQGSLSRTLA